MVDLIDLPGWPPWRFVAMSRYPANRSQGDLSDARARKLTFQLRGPASLTFDISGRSPQLGWLEELRSDVVAYRWSNALGNYAPIFRGCVTASQDAITPTVHTVSLTATDYRGVLARRLLRAATTYTATEQFSIASALALYGDAPPGVPTPAGALGLHVATLNPDGSPLAASGIVRDRAYLPGQVIAEALDNLSTDVAGFDWAVIPDANLGSTVNLWYPQRGITQPHWVAHYGSTVTDVARVVATTTYSNYVLALGGAATPGTNITTESIGAGYTDPVGNPEGPWMTSVADPTVITPAVLQQNGDGYLALYDDLGPQYTLTLELGRWSPADAWLGDTVRLIVNSGRIDVDTSVRITAVAVDIDDNGRETVTLTGGIPPPNAGQLVQAIDRRLDKLEVR